MHLFRWTKIQPVQTRHPAFRVLPRTVTMMIVAIALPLAMSNPAAANPGTWEGDWNSDSRALKRVVTCIAVTHQNTGKAGGNLTECTNPNFPDRDPKWDSSNLFKYDTTIEGIHTTKKGSNNCPNMPKGSAYVKCVFVYPANTVVTVGEVRWKDLRSEFAYWSLIK